ncbi:MAG: hypothetical protein COW13_02525 [Candidatus Omnitrophica bacterium CG12_big_fil_rev_8_21_14_0_65_50_5]|nr:MAG: hypothetical protein COW13_02525 [Candidatus Omnitrophica bacterium CG12_big_fil_rev_8_21_14_0_65_50_5]
MGYDPGKSGGIYGKAAGTYYGFEGIAGRALDHTASSNTLSGGGLLYDYDAIVGSAEIGWNAAKESDAVIKNFGIFGDIIQNLDDNATEDMGWMLGLKFGDKKISGKGQWQFKYMYGELEKDAWLDTFPDSDRYGGATDVNSHEAILEYGLHKNVILGLDVYRNDRMLAAGNEETLVQLDLSFKF